MRGIKISDSNPAITHGSRADEYWRRSGWDKLFKKVRPGMKLPPGFDTNDPEVLVKKFNLSGIGFGNWVTVEDRINYLYSMVYGFYDLNKVLRLNYNLGFGLLGISFGARGKGRALAHFEPGSWIINITRYERGFGSKRARFFGTGGIGSFAHEYGHFLDYFAGAYLAKSSSMYSLTNGHSISKDRTGSDHPVRIAMDDLMEEIIWQVPGEKLSRYYQRLLDTVVNTSKGEYWLRRNEIFARAFEVYINLKLKQNGIRNYLLTSTKYNPAVYLKDSEMQKLIGKFDHLISLIKKEIR
jgi:hypothetical protein